jgi:hypothetical protein
VCALFDQLVAPLMLPNAPSARIEMLTAERP